MSKTLRALGLALALLSTGCASQGSNRADDAAETAGAVVLEIFKGLAGWAIIP
jgi:hypothetical protein